MYRLWLNSEGKGECDDVGECVELWFLDPLKDVDRELVVPAFCWDRSDGLSEGGDVGWSGGGSLGGVAEGPV